MMRLRAKFRALLAGQCHRILRFRELALGPRSGSHVTSPIIPQHPHRRFRTIALALGLSSFLTETVSAQEGLTETPSCVPHGEVSRIVHVPARPVYATLEAANMKSRALTMHLATLLQEVASVFRPPSSATPLRTYSFTLRLHKDGRLSDAKPVEPYIPAALAEATIRAIDSASILGGIGPVFFDLDEDPLPLRMVFRLGERPSDTSVPFYELIFPAYLEFETDKPALTVPGNPAPRYPRELREQNIEGEVLMQFVVDTLGQPDMRTVRLLGPPRVYREFVQSVLAVLPKMRFTPAERRGCKVKQLVQLPFAFKLRRE